MCLVLTGCGLFELNQDRYLSRMVAQIDNDIIITKEDLIPVYNQYAPTLINSYGYSKEDAVEYCIDMLVNRKIMLKKAKELYPTLSEKETSKCWKDTYDSVNEILKSYEKDIMADWNIKDPTEEETASSTSDNSSSAYKPFEKQIQLKQDDATGDWYIEAIKDDDLKDVEVIVGGADKFLTTYRVISREDVSREALRKYIKALKKEEEGRTFEGEDAYSDDAVLERAINKIYQQYEENMYLSKLQDYLQENTVVEENEILTKHKEQILEDYVKYTANLEQFKTDILSSADGIYYVPEEYNGKYFYVSHFLVKFDEETQAQVDDLKKQLNESAIDQTAYDAAIDLIVANMKATIYNDGVKTDETILVSELYSNLTTELAGKTIKEKTEIFNNYIYKYNQDPGINNAEFAYVVGDEDSKMVKSFTEASRKLHRPNSEDTSILGNVGDISDIVVSEYGIHIIMYCGEVENLFNVNKDNVETFELKNADLKTMDDTLLYACNNKTLLDKIYEGIYKDKYSTYESEYVKSLKENSIVKIYKKAYKDLID